VPIRLRVRGLLTITALYSFIHLLGVQQIIRDRTLQQGATVPVKPPPLTAEPAEDELTVQESVVYEMLGHRIDHRTSLVKEALKSDVQNMIQRLSAPVDPRNQEMEVSHQTCFEMGLTLWVRRITHPSGPCSSWPPKIWRQFPPRPIKTFAMKSVRALHPRSAAPWALSLNPQ